MPSYFDAPKSHKIYPTDSVEGLADVREALKLFAGRQVHVTYKTPGHTFRDESNNLCKQRGKKLINETWKVPDLKQGFSGWWRQVSKSYKFCCSSDAWLWDEYPNGFVKFELLDVLPNKPCKAQCFRDGAISHCMLTPMLEWAFECAERAEQRTGKAAAKRAAEWRSRVAAVQDMLLEFEDGVPESRLPEVCNRLKVDVEVQLPFHQYDIEKPMLKVGCTGKCLKKFKYVNTRMNHVDGVNQVVCKDTAVECAREQLEEISKDLLQRKEHFLFTNSQEGISKIYTLANTYALKDEYSEVASEWEKASNIDVGTFVYEKDADLYGFCWQGCRFNGCVDVRPVCAMAQAAFTHGGHFLNNADEQESYEHRLTECASRPKKKWKEWEMEEVQEQWEGLVGHIDMARAYSNCHTCQYWEGVCFKLTDFRATDTVQGVGLYWCVDIDLSNAEAGFVAVNDCLGGAYDEDAVLSSAEVAFLTDKGAKFDIVAGCWGVGAVDLRFSHRMVETKTEGGVRFYSKWFGCNLIENQGLEVWMYGDSEYAQVLQEHLGQDRLRVHMCGEDNSLLRVNFQKDSHKNRAHVNGQMLGYQRLMMFEQLAAMDVSKVLRVCVDGVYFEEHDFELKNVFRRKELEVQKILQHLTDARRYTWSKDCKVGEMEFAPARESHRIELHKGPGGSGKTHLNLHDTGLVRLCYLAPSHKLCARKRQETGLPARVHAVALSADTTKHEQIHRYGVLVIDEVSMTSNEAKQIFIDRYPHHKLIFVGDVGYQLPPVAVGSLDCTPFNEAGIDLVKTYTTSFRCKCTGLAYLQLELRRSIDLGHKVTTESFLAAFVNAGGSVVSHERLRAMYQIDDMILTFTHNRADSNAESVSQEDFFGVTDKHLPKQKYQITCNTRDNTKGEIVVRDSEPQYSRVRHSYTVHCVQGETFRAPNRLFIDLYKFDRSDDIAQLLYTAVSRAEKLEQIHLIKHTTQQPAPQDKHTGRTGRIYKLYSPAEPKWVYIGHTIELVKQRFAGHIKAFNKPGARKCTSAQIFEKHGYDVKCELVQETPLESRTHILQVEQQQMELHRQNGYTLVNSVNPVAQAEEQCVCDCGASYRTRNRSRHEASQRHKRWVDSTAFYDAEKTDLA